MRPSCSPPQAASPLKGTHARRATLAARRSPLANSPRPPDTHSLLLALAAAAATAASAQPLPPPPFAAAAATPDPPAPASTHAHLADLLTGVLLLREGSVKDAAAALPGLHDLAKAYVLALEALAAAPGDITPNKTEWAGLSASQAAGLMKSKAAAAWNASGAAFRDKVAHTTDPLWEKGVELQAKFGGNRPPTNKTDVGMAMLAGALDAKARAENKSDDPFLADLQAKLAAFNVHFSDKMIETPSKFRNFGALVMKHVSGAMLGAYGVDFNPWCERGKKGRARARRLVWPGRPPTFRHARPRPGLWPLPTHTHAPVPLFSSLPRSTHTYIASSPSCPPRRTCRPRRSTSTPPCSARRPRASWPWRRA